MSDTDQMLKSWRDGPAIAATPKPTVGRIVHFRMPGSDDCWSAIVTVTHPDSDTKVDLCVFIQTGLMFRLAVEQANTTGRGTDPGSWHWPAHGGGCGA